MKTPIAEIDNIIHRERVTANGAKVTHEERLKLLPGGAFVMHQDKAYLIKESMLYLWTSAGYEQPVLLPDSLTLSVLTPKSIANMFSAGYVPQMAV